MEQGSTVGTTTINQQYLTYTTAITSAGQALGARGQLTRQPQHLRLHLQSTANQDTGALSACLNHAAHQPCLAAVMRPQTGVPPALPAPADDRS